MHSYARQGPVIAPFPSPSEHPATSRVPIEARWSRARAALLHADQLRRAAAPSHWDCHQVNESCKSMPFVKRSASSDVPSQTIRMSKAEYAVTSCQPGLDHPSSKLSMSTCSWFCGWLHNNPSSNGSWNSRCRAVADASEPSQRAINESVAFTHHPTRDGARRDQRHRERAVLAGREQGKKGANRSDAQVRHRATR